VVAPRSRPEPDDPAPPPRVGARTSRPGGPLALLAARWSALAPDPVDDAVAGRLVRLLQRLASVLHAEPFCPGAARPIGAALRTIALSWSPNELGPDELGPAELGPDVLPASLRLLRAGASALGVSDVADERRLTAVLDEFVAGFADHSPTAQGYRMVFEQGSVGIALVGRDGLLIDMNPWLLGLLGFDELPAEPPPFTDFVHPGDLPYLIERFVRAQPPLQRTEARLVGTDSVVVRVYLTASLARHRDGRSGYLVVFIEEVTQRSRPVTRLQHASARDQLTRLPGPALVDRWLRRAFAPGGADRVGVCVLDLDGFQAVNDALGDQVGDRVLLGVVGRLRLAAGKHLVARTGSDEFTVLVADPADAADAGRVADGLQAALGTPFVIAGHTVAVTVSIGVAEGATACSCPAELLRDAEVARSWAKAMGGGRRVVFDHRRDAGEASRFSLLHGLRGGIGRNEFRLDYQPLVRLGDGALAGVEALVRWQHPERGLIGPGRFIELAESSGAILPLGRWVLETACARAAGWWRDLGPDAPYVSVNVSPVQLAEPGWPHEVTAVLAETGLPAAKLQLEITEQTVLGDDPSILAGLATLRDAGVRLALDDFGTGYSSFGWLRRLPVHTLKIDGSFIDGLRRPTMDPVDAAIIQALIDMAHALGLVVTAEWVETPAQAERLAAMGCDTGQGRWFGDAGPGEWVPQLWRRSIAP
jgi:diguanylate cyclase (GGDEF)-like protein